MMTEPRRITGFYGNVSAVTTLEGMLGRDRIPQTMLLAGPEGVGKATLVRRFAAALLGDADKIERDDLSRPGNADLIADREKWPADKRADDPLLFSTHPDFVTFPPDGPLRQISIQQMRLLRERAPYKPLRGRYRVFLIDRLDRANEQAANSLLKTLEEPPEHLLLFATARNAYDLLPTIRSRSVILHLAPLSEDEMQAFAASHGVTDAALRLALAGGSPGVALSLDLEAWRKRRMAMLNLLRVAAGEGQFAEWAKTAEAIASSRSEKLDTYLEVLYSLLEDIVHLKHGNGRVRNTDVRSDLVALADRVDFEWIRRAVVKVDELVEFVRRNVQKGIALDALVTELRA
jgi:DNA polymerase-3 subunit delta'